MLHWSMLAWVALLLLAVFGIVLITRQLSRLDDVSMLGVTKLSGGSATPTATLHPNLQQDSYIVIPDLSGYTHFMRLNRFAAGHAQFVVAQLLDAIMTAAQPPLSPTRVDGDSVMFYAVTEGSGGAEGVSGREIARAVSDIVEAFYRKRADLLAGNVCPCTACQHICELDLKVIVHRGEIIRYQLRGLEDLSGLAVIEAHRLLKNSVGRPRYVLVSEAASRDVLLRWNRTPAQHCESYEGVGEVCCDLYLLSEEPSLAGEGAASPVQDIAGKLASNARSLIGDSR